jgi:methylated-DNA-[protein]-cysteine S-methyltransferase
LALAATPAGLAGVFFDGQRHLPKDLANWPSVPSPDDHPVLAQTARELTQYFAGQRTVFDVALDLSGGTAFQQAVWQALLTIRCGDHTSYGRLSADIGKAAAVRAVGSAVGRNPISIIVPCHRVLGSDGSLTGYAGGLHRKTALLTLEGVLPCKHTLTGHSTDTATGNLF